MVRQRKAFTTIELLVAIGIILLLIGMLVIGINKTQQTTKRNDVKVILGNARGMLGELEAVAKTEYQTINSAFTTPVVAPTDMGGTNKEGVAVQNTQWVYFKMRSVPANRDVMTKIPPEKVYVAKTNGALIPAGAPATISPLPTPAPFVPILIDSWGYPMIFVPPQGLSGVTVGGITYTVATPLKSPDGRPYFASCGEDGDFAKGDDNVYSFEN